MIESITCTVRNGGIVRAEITKESENTHRLRYEISYPDGSIEVNTRLFASYEEARRILSGKLRESR